MSRFNTEGAPRLLPRRFYESLAPKSIRSVPGLKVLCSY